MGMYVFKTWHPDGLGPAKNQACAVVPFPEDWVVLVDADVMLFQPWAELAQQAVASEPRYDVYTCMATRTWAKGKQQMPGGVRNIADLRTLRMAVANQAEVYGAKVEPLESQVSGFFLMFQKRLWLEFPFKTEGWNGHRSLGVETEWIDRLRQANRTVGLMAGIVALHYYRMVEGDRSRDHLK